MQRWAPALFVILLSGCGPGQSTAAGSKHAALGTSCDYLSTPDFQSTIGHALVGYRTGPSCSYRDQLGDTCNVVVARESGQYSDGKMHAATYGSVESLAVGDRGFFSAQLQVPPAVWVFDFGFVKGDAFVGGLCGGRFSSANPKPLALKLANRIASHL
jgi:hypothetical protein